jgi:hypothetical protein
VRLPALARRRAVCAEMDPESSCLPREKYCHNGGMASVTSTAGLATEPFLSRGKREVLA